MSNNIVELTVRFPPVGCQFDSSSQLSIFLKLGGIAETSISLLSLENVAGRFKYF